MKNQKNCNPTPQTPRFRPPSSVVPSKSKIRDQGSRSNFLGPLFPRTPMRGNRIDYQRQPKV